MADPVDNGSFFNLAGLGNLITGVTDAYKTQTLAEDQMRATEEQESAFLLQSAQAVNQVVKQEAVTQLQLQQRQKQINDLSVGKPIDILGLAAMQLLDPMNTTQEGIQQQAAQSQQRTQLAAQMHDANANVSAYRVAHTKAKLASDLGATARALGGIKVQVDAMGTMLQGFAASEQLRLSSLEQLPPSKLDALLNSPELARGDEYVMADGFRYSAVELRTKKNNDSIAAAVLALPLDQQNPLLGKAKADQQQLYLSHLSLPALQELQKNGGQLPNGDMVDGVTLDGHIQQAMSRAQTAMTLAIEGKKAELALPNMFKAGLELVESQRKQNHLPGTPLYNAAQRYETALGAISVASQTQDMTVDVNRVAVSTQLSAARAAWDEEVMQEATRQASGDERLAPIIYAQLTGQPTDPRAITDYVTAQYKDGKPFARVFQDSAMSNEMSKNINSAFESLKAEGMQANMGAPLPASELKLLREEAARVGIEQFQADRAIAAVNLAETAAFEDQNNPLVVKGKMTQGEYAQLEAQARYNAARDATSQLGLDPNAITWIKNKQGRANGISAEVEMQAIEIYNQQQVGYLYDLIDQRNPGLAGEYVSWLNSNFVPTVHKVNTQVNQGTADLITAEVHDAANNIRAQWVHADETRTNRGKQVISEFYTGANNPEIVLKASILSMRELTDQQKQTILTKVIKPISDQAKAQKLTPEQAAEHLMAVLDGGFEGDVALDQAARKALRALPATIANTMSVIGQMQAGGIESVESREALASQLEKMTTGTTPTEQQRQDAELFVRVPGNTFWGGIARGLSGSGRLSQGAEGFLSNPGGPEAAIEFLRNQK